MKQNNPLTLLIGWITLALVPTHPAMCTEGRPVSISPPQTGAITGQIRNAATGRTLEGARVVLQGTTREAITDNQGVYRFADVAPGSVVVSVSYTGLNPVDVPVVVSPGAPTRRDVGLTADIYTMSQFVVPGEREGNAQAITLQRQSDGVKSIVSTDAFGSLAGNPADLLIHLPGVEGESVGGDIRFIRVRGMNQNLLTVTLDGDRIGSANRSATNRDFEFSQSNADAIERIEVVKSPTPDMDGDSIGGAVNMVSKSAFDSSPERRISGSFGASWRAFDSRDYARPNYSLAYSEVFGGRLGVSLNWGYRETISLAQFSTLSHEQLPNGVAGPAYTYSLAITDFRNPRTRAGLGLKLDYKLSDKTRFFMNLLNNKYWEHEATTGATWSTGQALATRDANGNFTGTGGIVPGYTDSKTDIRAVTSSNLNLNSQNLFQDGKLRNIQFGGVHRYETLNIDYSAYRTQSKVNYVGVSNPHFIIRDVGFRIEQVGDPYWRAVTQTAGRDWTKIENYTENSYNVTPQATWDGLQGAALNVKQRFTTPVPAYIKTGVRWREQTRKIENKPRSGVYVGRDGVMGVNPATGINDDNLAQFTAYRPMVDELARYNNLPFPRVVIGTGRFDPALEELPQYFQESTAANLQSDLTNDRQFRERVGAYYIMGNVDLGKLSILGGVRVETTETWGEGALQAISPEEKARRAVWADR